MSDLFAPDDTTAADRLEKDPNWRPPTSYNQVTPEWYDERARKPVEAMGQREADFARDAYERRMQGQDSVALAARIAQMGDVRRRAALQAAMGPMALRQSMYGAADKGIGVLRSTAGAHQMEIEQARQAAAQAYGRRSDYELMLQKLHNQRQLAGDKAWQQHEQRRQQHEDALDKRTEDWIMGMGQTAVASGTAGMGAGGGG